MNLDRLRAVQAEEREADSLRPLPDAFYREVADYLDELREQRAAAAAASDDPFGAEDVRRLTDEIENAEEVVEAIYERRVGKLVKRASLAAAGMPADEEGLTSEEAELFADLVAEIEAHRETVLASFSGGGRTDVGAAVTERDQPGSADSGAEVDDDGPGSSVDASDAMGGGLGSEDAPSGADDAPPPPPDEPVTDDDEPVAEGTVDADADESLAGGDEGDPPDDAEGSTGDSGEPTEDEGSTDGGQGTTDHERVTVRITADVGEVFGVDERTYDLASEDVVTLPAANAKPLLDRDAAEKVE